MRYFPTARLILLVVLSVSLPAPTVAAQASDVDSTRAADANGARSTALRILPVLGSAPETGFVGGATALRVSSPIADSMTRASTEQVYVAYTAKQQLRAFVSTDRWSEGNRWGLNAQVECQRFPQPFFGIGIDASKSAEEWYEARSLIAGVAVLRHLTRAFYGQLGLRYTRTTIRDVEAGGVIGRGEMAGARGGTVSQIVTGLAWDSRDNLFAPAKGAYVLATAAHGGSVSGSDYRFGHYVADARRYWRVGRGVLAGQAYLEATSGEAPFDQMALLGSSSAMRGYVHGRYRDHDLVAGQVEYRMPVSGRLGAAAFIGAGTVAPTISQLGSSTLLPTFGSGARWLLLPKQRTTIRVDYAKGKSSSGFYVAFNEAF